MSRRYSKRQRIIALSIVAVPAIAALLLIGGKQIFDMTYPWESPVEATETLSE